MKILFIAGGSPATVFALAPLATAARNSGHQTFMAATDDMMPVVTAAGLAGVPLTGLPIRHFITTDRTGKALTIPADPAEQARFTGAWFARMAVASLPALLELAAGWRPDVVVGGTMCYAAPLLAARLGIPHVRQAWDAVEATGIHPGADDELQPELRELGLDRLPEPDLFVDICPPSLRPADAGPAQQMRFVPANAQRALEPWMYRRGDRPRVCVTSGSRVTRGRSYDQNYEFLRDLIGRITTLDVELVVAAPEEVAEGLRAEYGDLRAGWVPLDVVAPTCDALVHHGGGVTSLTALAAGLPQLLMPKGAVLVEPARRIARQGAAVVLAPDQETTEMITEKCREIVTTPSYRTAAVALSREIAAMPPPADVVGALEKLVQTPA
ncbi:MULTISPECIES: nucleotide disphospho-sugar-binding domain-containing protein [unclassified Micromonospora]|uniref:nucleotide disphospho-sugar-binding domain-containing protein n=1 Tax=unclassified Micromonospora TaxID=2617518 RepID=UPI0036346EF7